MSGPTESEQVAEILRPLTRRQLAELDRIMWRAQMRHVIYGQQLSLKPEGVLKDIAEVRQGVNQLFFAWAFQ